MDDRQPTRPVCCPECGATYHAGHVRCWLCGGPLTDLPPPRAVQLPQRETRSASFRLNSLMLTITLLAVWLGVMRLAPGLGILLAVVLAPAFIRTVVLARQQIRQGRPLAMGEKIFAFAGSVGVVVAIIFSAAAAGFFACSTLAQTMVAVMYVAGGRPNALPVVIALAVGLMSAMAILVVVGRALWPYRPRNIS